MTALGWCDLQVSCSSCPVTTPSVVTTLPGSRIIRQSSQPESSAPCCGVSCVHGTAPSTSLRQLRDHGDGIAGIAADSLRINGAMRNFRQVWGWVEFGCTLQYFIYLVFAQAEGAISKLFNMFCTFIFHFGWARKTAKCRFIIF